MASHVSVEILDEEDAGPVRTGWEVELVRLADTPDARILRLRVDGEFDLTDPADRQQIDRIQTAIQTATAGRTEGASR